MASLKTKESFDAVNTFCCSINDKVWHATDCSRSFYRLVFHERNWWLFLCVGMLAPIICVAAVLIKTAKCIASQFDKSGKQIWAG